MARLALSRDCYRLRSLPVCMLAGASEDQKRAGRRDTRLMSSANVDLVRSICAAWERGDWSSAEWADREIEYVIADGPSPGRWTGLAGMATGGRANLDVWQDLRAVPEACRELDDERVLVLVRYG